MVPGSTLMYGSSLHIVTFRPRHLSSRPSEEAVRPLPSDEDTPPVKKMYLVCRPLTSRTVTIGHPPRLPERATPTCGPRTGTGSARTSPPTPLAGAVAEQLAGVATGRLAVGAARQHPADLDHPPVGPSSTVTSDRVRPPSSTLRTSTWWSAWAATWARWVTTSTCA